MGFLEALLDGGEFLEPDSIGFDCDDFVYFVVEVLQLLAELFIGGFVVLHQPLLVAICYHYLLPSHYINHEG